MTQDRREAQAVAGVALQAAPATADRVGHLHFDRQARVWRSHSDLVAPTASVAVAAAAVAHGVWE